MEEIQERVRTPSLFSRGKSRQIVQHISAWYVLWSIVTLKGEQRSCMWDALTVTIRIIIFLPTFHGFIFSFMES